MLRFLDQVHTLYHLQSATGRKAHLIQSLVLAEDQEYQLKAVIHIK